MVHVDLVIFGLDITFIKMDQPHIIGLFEIPNDIQLDVHHYFFGSLFLISRNNSTYKIRRTINNKYIRLHLTHFPTNQRGDINYFHQAESH